MRDYFTSIGGKDCKFISTYTSIMNCNESDNTNEMLQKIVQTYWKPVYVYIRLYWNKSNEDAKDLTQEFFTNFIGKELYKTFRSTSFRSCLKTALKSFLIDENRKVNAVKRGGQYDFSSLDNVDDIECYNSCSPEKAFDDEWRICVVSSALEDLQQVLHEQGNDIYFRVFKLRELSREDETPTYKEIADMLNLTEQKVKDHLEYTRKLYKRIAEIKIKDYMLDSADISEELSELFYV